MNCVIKKITSFDALPVVLIIVLQFLHPALSHKRLQDNSITKATTSSSSTSL